MKKYMPLEGPRWSRDSGSTLCDTPQNGRSRTGWGQRGLPGSCDFLRTFKHRTKYTSVRANELYLKAL